MIVKNTGVKTCDGDDAELIVPPHHESEVCPKWLGERALKCFPGVDWTFPVSDSYFVTSVERELGDQEWLDHWGAAVYDGKEYLVSEPYDLNRKKVDQLVRFCDSLDLVFSIQASGHHNPTKTMRILIWPKEWPQADELEFDVAAYKVRAQDEQTRICEARAAEALRAITFRLTPCQHGTEADSKGEFALEQHLRDYLARNLDVLEEGMTLWPVQKAVEFPTGDGRRTDILARDRNGIPTVIETKVGKGHEETIGQVANYRAMVRRRLSATRVRVLIVARKASPGLLRAAGELQDCAVLEYRLTIDFRQRA